MTRSDPVIRNAIPVPVNNEALFAIDIRSSRSCWTKRRHACPTFVRQSFHECAGESIRHCRWARAYYARQKAHGKKHHTIARSLAFKWQRIITRCWRNHTTYDDANYMQSLQHHKPERFQLALVTKLPKEGRI